MKNTSGNSTPELLAIGLNPAWQKTFFFAHLQPGAVNRAERVNSGASGKGINFAYAVQQAGGCATVAGFAGGITGGWLTADLDVRGIPHTTIQTAAPTRVCNTLLSGDDHVTTEIIEPSGEITPAEFAALREAVLTRLSHAAAFAICGTFPPGVPMSFAAEAATAARKLGIPVLLDAYRGVAPVLEVGVDVLKINATELRELAGKTDTDEAAAELFACFPRIGMLAVTDGPGTARLFISGNPECSRGSVSRGLSADTADGTLNRSSWRLTMPKLPHVVNPIGAGDCTAGVLLLRLVQKAKGERQKAEGDPRIADLSPEIIAECFREALACACASCLEERPTLFDPAAAARLREEILVTRTQ